MSTLVNPQGRPQDTNPNQDSGTVSVCLLLHRKMPRLHGPLCFHALFGLMRSPSPSADALHYQHQECCVGSSHLMYVCVCACVCVCVRVWVWVWGCVSGESTRTVMHRCVFVLLPDEEFTTLGAWSCAASGCGCACVFVCRYVCSQWRWAVDWRQLMVNGWFARKCQLAIHGQQLRLHFP